MDHLGLDEVSIILKNIPVVSVIRFASLIREAISLIKTSEFVADYTHLASQYHLFLVNTGQQYLVFVFRDDTVFENVSYDMVIPPLILPSIDYPMIGTTYGLFGLLEYNTFTLWNPSTRRTLTLPIPDPQPMLISFGVCPNTLDPKVIGLFPKENRAILYTLSPLFWKRHWIEINVPNVASVFWNSYVVVDGFIHWLGEDLDDDDSSRLFIVSFNVTTEEFTTFDVPPHLGLWVSIDNIRGLLGLVTHNDNRTSVWVVEGNEDRHFRELITWDTSDLILGFTKDFTPIMAVDTQDGSEVALYHQDLDEFTRLGIFGEDHACFMVRPYVETLLLFDREDAVGY